MADNAHYTRLEFAGAPSSGDAVLLPLYIRDNGRKIFSCYSVGDKEGFFDNLMILIQKPVSAITTIGNAILLIRETPFFKSAVTWIPTFAQALSGAGIFLSITQLFLETMGMKRVVTFQNQFINSPPPESNDLYELKKWADHTRQLAVTAQKGFKYFDAHDPAIREAMADLTEVIDQCDRVLHLNESMTEDTRILRAVHLDIVVQKVNLKLLKKYKEKAEENDTFKDKLHRRLGIQFVRNLSIQALDDHINALTTLAQELPKEIQLIGDELGAGLDCSDSDKLLEARNSIKTESAIIEKMQIQLNKRKIAHTLGSIGSSLTAAGCAFSILGMPQIGFPLILLGSLFGMARFLFWITYSESTEWERETDKWVNNQILTVQEVFADIKDALSSLITLLPDALPEPEEVQTLEFKEMPSTSASA